MAADRFRGVTSNGALPGGESGRERRSLERVHGITPTVGGGDRGNQGRRRQRPKGRLKQISNGVWVWVPREEPTL